MVVTFINRTDLVTLLSLSVSTMPFFTVRYVMYDVTRVITMGTSSPNSTTIRTGDSALLSVYKEQSTDLSDGRIPQPNCAMHNGESHSKGHK